MPQEQEQGRRPTDIGTHQWQAMAGDQQSTELSNYLEQVANSPELQEVAEYSLECLALTRGQHVLEVGCGSGVFLPLLADAVKPEGRVTGIDHSPSFVAEARERIHDLGLLDSVTVETADAYTLPFSDDAFDAAHCERVLMHLDDPAEALREMRRVVSPGGWIVAAEPDWQGIRIDHPDRTALDLLVSNWLPGFQNPAMGLELKRCFADAGLMDRHVMPLVLSIDTYAGITKFGFDLTEPAKALVEQGRLTKKRANDALDYLTASTQSGSFFGYLCMFVTAGRVPEEQVRSHAWSL